MSKLWLHVLPGRARARVPELLGNPVRCAELQTRLAGCRGVRSAAANAVTATVLIHYDPSLITLAHLEFLLWSRAAAETAATLETVVSEALPAAVLPTGLSTAEVERRRASCGANLLSDPPRQPFLRRLLNQYRDVMQLTLMGGAALSLLSGHRRDALTIGGVLLLNGLIGASQDGTGRRSVAALQSLSSRPARVVRDGLERTVAAGELVPGDLLLLEAGEQVPADAAVVSSVGLAVDESLLTGECAAADKSAAGSPLSAGTAVVRGRGRALVTAVGMESTLGQIAALMERDERPAPLQRHLDTLGRRAAQAGLWVVAGVTGMALLRGQGALTALLSGVSLAISAIPEGLPTFATLALASGASRMRQHNAAFQNLAAVETMGTIDVLCCDKTGTLTQGQMCVTEICLPDSVWQVTGDGYSPYGAFLRGGLAGQPLADQGLRDLLKVGALCNNARIGVDEEGALVTQGDPTELALLVAALKAGLRASGGEGDRLLEIPFDSDRRLMTIVCRDVAGQATACVKGAPETLLPLCSRIRSAGTVRRMEGRLRRKMSREAAAMAARGLRVLAVAYRSVPASAGPEQAEQALTLLGLVGMADPPRPDASRTVARCRTAGVRVLMITGDHPATAASVAAHLGILKGEDELLTGEQLAQMDEAQRRAAISQVTVVARATPEQKLQVVRTLRGAGHVVAMTGDGVNDGPAMREADVGIAMGDRGTEVARATAALVLEDDRLETVVAAIEQGRSTRGNLRRTAGYLLGSNAAEVCMMAASLLLGLPLPLLPVQLLWMNMVGDGLPAGALGAQPPEGGLMNRPPERAGNLVGRGFTKAVVGHGLRTGLVATGLYVWALASGRSLAQARTLGMATLAAGQVHHLYNSRSRGPDRQIRTAGTAAACLALAAIYFPPLRRALQFAPLGAGELALATGLALAVK